MWNSGKQRTISETKDILIFMHKFKMLGTNGCFVSFINFITDTIKRPTTKLFIPMVKGYSKEHKKLALLNIHGHFNRMHHPSLS